MKKISILAIILAAFVILPYVSLAQTGSSVSDVLSGIRQSQNVSSNSAIKCDKVSDGQFEELGDAAMDAMNPNEKQHELMDQMMGGEGSDSLRAMHTLMGQRYLGCAAGYYGMMGGGYGMMGSNGYYGGMMGNYGSWGWFGWIPMVLFWVLLIFAIIAVARWLMGGARKESALDILKERYAKGEISKEEFETKKKDLV